MEGVVKSKIKPHFMGWYENDFQAELGVRRMKPIERHFYRALLIQSFFCAERPYLPNDDDQLWVLADADSKEHWKEHRDVVMGMFKKYGATRWGHPRVLRDWKATEDKYTGKRKLQDTLGQPELGLTGGKQNRTEQSRPSLQQVKAAAPRIRTDRNRGRTIRVRLPPSEGRVIWAEADRKKALLARQGQTNPKPPKSWLGSFGMPSQRRRTTTASGAALRTRRKMAVSLDGRRLCAKHDYTDYKAKWEAAIRRSGSVEEL
jgi:uncharacterized protein YdaU (DUF1376 family)